MIKVDEKKLDAVLGVSLFKLCCSNLAENYYGVPCNHGNMEAEYPGYGTFQFKSCQFCDFKNIETIKEWLRKEDQH